MSFKEPDVSVIIVTYNSAQVVAACVDSIINNNQDVEVEILIVDNASTDDTCEIITRNYPDITLISGHGNLGFAAGNNIGFQAAKGRHFLVLNPDTEISSGALRALTDYADTHPKVGMIAPHVINPDGTLQHSTFRFPD
ncbi:MAG: glycosyltransferase family 2 protein, partial [Chloroflexota bacterium]|nr:glycosyltransferase family 2 protein [Chloroflexota bacterium]